MNESLINFSQTMNYDEIIFILNNPSELSKIGYYESLLLMKMVEKKNADIAARLAKAYYNGDGLFKNQEKAVNLLIKAVNNGSAKAALELGMHHYKLEEYMKAAEYLQICINNSNKLNDHELGDCFGILGDCYLHGQGQYHQKGIDYLLTSAEKYEKASAYKVLGFYFLDNKNSYFNIEKGIKYLEKSAKQGDLTSILEIASYYLFGNKDYGIKRNGKKVEEILIPNINLNHFKIYLFLGFLYFDGDEENGIKEDYIKAIKYYEKSEELSGSGLSFPYLGRAYYMCGEYKKAELYLLKAEQNNNYRYSDFLGRIYKDGLIGEKDNDKALIHYEKAYKTNNINNVFTCYEYTELLMEMKNYEKAFEVANYGDDVYNDISFVYIKGYIGLLGTVNTGLSTRDAISLLELCIKYEHNLKEVCMVLGDYYFNSKLYKKAESYYLMAFEQGAFYAGVCLARLYERGSLDIPQNNNLAYNWFVKSADKGDEIAKKEVECWKKGLLGGYRRVRSI